MVCVVVVGLRFLCKKSCKFKFIFKLVIDIFMVDGILFNLCVVVENEFDLMMVLKIISCF